MVAPILGIVVLVGVLAFIVELVIAFLIAGVVLAIRSLLRRGWVCRVTGPDSTQWDHITSRLRDARALRAELAGAISSGDLTSVRHPQPRP
ncbi:MAG: hypothetical protein GY926_18620 [bacterium]|nr:hypothetical protein [bacterium]